MSGFLGDGSANIISGGTQLAATGGMSPLGWVNVGLGGLESIGGLLGLNSTPKYQSQTIDPAIKNMVSRAQDMAKQGYTPQEITAFYNQQAMQNNARFQHGTDQAGGNLAQSVNNSNNAFNVGALNQFAANDAKLKQQHQLYADQTLKYLQGLEDKSWMQDNAHRQGLENAFGGALKQGLSNITGGIAGMAFGKGNNSSNNNPYSGLGSGGSSYLGGGGAGNGFGGGSNGVSSDAGMSDIYNPNIQYG